MSNVYRFSQTGQGLNLTKMASRMAQSDLTFVDDTMAEIRRNWNVTTQDDVSRECKPSYFTCFLSIILLRWH